MIYNFFVKDMILCKDIIMPEMTPEIRAEILHYREPFSMERLLGSVFIEGYYTALKFPPEATDITARQAQRMNYEYCVQTMAGLIKEICARGFKMTGG